MFWTSASQITRPSLSILNVTPTTFFGRSFIERKEYGPQKTVDMQSTRSTLKFHKADCKSTGYMVTKQTYPAKYSTEDHDIKLQIFVRTMHDI